MRFVLAILFIGSLTLTTGCQNGGANGSLFGSNNKIPPPGTMPNNRGAAPPPATQPGPWAPTYGAGSGYPVSSAYPNTTAPSIFGSPNYGTTQPVNATTGNSIFGQPAPTNYNNNTLSGVLGYNGFNTNYTSNVNYDPRLGNDRGYESPSDSLFDAQPMQSVWKGNSTNQFASSARGGYWDWLGGSNARIPAPGSAPVPANYPNTANPNQYAGNARVPTQSPYTNYDPRWSTVPATQPTNNQVATLPQPQRLPTTNDPFIDYDPRRTGIPATTVSNSTPGTTLGSATYDPNRIVLPELGSLPSTTIVR